MQVLLHSNRATHQDEVCQWAFALCMPAFQLHCHASLGKTCTGNFCICETKAVLAIHFGICQLLLIVCIPYYVVPSNTTSVLNMSQLQALVPIATSPSCMRLGSWTSCRHVECRKVKAFMDDAEVIIPLKGYNPETRTKISSHVTTTARSTAGHTPRYEGGAAPHHMQGPCVFTADATGHDTQPSIV